MSLVCCFSGGRNEELSPVRQLAALSMREMSIIWGLTSTGVEPLYTQSGGNGKLQLISHKPKISTQKPQDVSLIIQEPWIMVDNIIWRFQKLRQ